MRAPARASGRPARALRRREGTPTTDDRCANGRVALRIRGRVQGVGFRFSAIDEATRLGLTGWVRNTHDGDVELVAEGAENGLRRFVAWCHAGPPGARVTDVVQQWQPYTGAFDGFRLRR